MNSIKNIKLSGYKSINNLELEFGKLNILIGCNGAGKSNLISYFKMLLRIKQYEFQNFITEQGGANAVMYNGKKITNEIEISICRDKEIFNARLKVGNSDRLYFAQQSLYNHLESTNYYAADGFEELKDNGIIDKMKMLDGIGIYHFCDTSTTSPIKAMCRINDNMQLASDGRNISAILFRIKQTDIMTYHRIVNVVKMVVPYFNDFVLRENPLNTKMIQLEWNKVGCDIPFSVDQLSDGTIRFICLVTLLCQPNSMRKEVIIIDEPELGLHPYAITIVSELIKKYSYNGQVIVATQSADFINEFDTDNIIVVDNEKGESIFKRLDKEELAEWLEDYTIGELWKKNVIGGRP